MAKYTLTIETDDPEDFAAIFGTRAAVTVSETVTKTPEAVTVTETVTEEVAALPKRAGRPPKQAEPATAPPAEAPTEAGATIADVTALIHRVVKEKSAKAAVEALTAACGTPSPAAMTPAQLATAADVLKGLLNG